MSTLTKKEVFAMVPLKKRAFGGGGMKMQFV